MLIQETSLTVPGGVEGTKDIVLDLAAILTAEARQKEVATVTPMKAPELLATFAESWRDLDKIVKFLTAAKIAVERVMVRRASEMILGEIPEMLKALDITSTKDTRDACIALDPETIKMQERFDQIVAAGEYLKGKQKSFENSYSSVKKVMGENAFDMSNRLPNQNLKGTTEVGSNTGNASSRGGWGKSRYGNQ